MVCALSLYAAALVALTWARPLWLDEILTLLIIRIPNLGARLATTHQTPGAVPLGFEIQRLVMQWFGYSTLTARLPAALFGVLALGGMLAVAREMGTRSRWFTGLTWAVLPLLLRYSVEARPYALALFLSVASTFLLFRMMREPRAGWIALYAAAVTLGLYTQPYTLFLQAGLVAPLLFEKRAPGRRVFLLGSICMLGGALLFAPWFLVSAPSWHAYAQRMNETLVLPRKLPLLVLREISGGSYVCSLSLAAFVAAGCVSRRLGGTAKRQLLAGAACCLVLALACDTVVGYFFAIRQILPALVPLCLLAGEGWAEARERWGAYPRLAVLMVLVASALVKNAAYFRDRSENWEQAARRLEHDAAAGCVLYPRTDAPGLYEWFAPQLKSRACGTTLQTADVFMPVTKYSNAEEVRRASEGLASRGYQIKETEGAGEVIEIRHYEKVNASAGSRPTAPYNQ